ENTYSDLYRKNLKDNELPYWMKQHNFYSKIGLKPECRKDFYSFSNKDNDFFIPKTLTKKQKHKICNAAIKYYFHIKNKDMVKKYANFCKENNIKY
ncbi:MAG: hypothetical protein GXO49_07230, partial [Chlorobi bacterium]|nr:hypothetical protein [Chlorobiota bacterium]